MWLSLVFKNIISWLTYIEKSDFLYGNATAFSCQVFLTFLEENLVSIKKSIGSGLASAVAIATIVSCAEPTPVEEADSLAADTYEQAAVVEGVAGGIVQKTSVLTATVKAIDYSTRKVTLVDQDGNQKTLEFGPEAVNFNQVEKGDQVTIEMIDQLAVYLAEDGTTAGATSEEGVALLSAEGEKPAALMADTIETEATVLAVDLEAHAVTLGFEDGSQNTVTARPDVVLSEAQVGKVVVMRATTAIALSVEKVVSE